jgi:hypothetical protein
MNNYYVYAHYTPDTNEVFYIGKGKGRRAWVGEKSRFVNLNWCRKVETHGGFVVKLLHENLTEGEALLLEWDTMNQIGFDKLTNTKGYLTKKTQQQINQGRMDQIQRTIDIQRTPHKPTTKRRPKP